MCIQWLLRKKEQCKTNYLKLDLVKVPERTCQKTLLDIKLHILIVLMVLCHT